MCLPALAAAPGLMSGLQIVSSVVGLVGQMQAQQAQEEANQRQYTATMQARAANLNQTNLMQQQEREASMQKLEESNLKAQAARSTARVSSGEAGVSGLSVDALLADINSKQNRFDSAVQTNYDRAGVAIDNQRINIQTNAANQINSLKTPAMPDYFSAALRIGNAITKTS